MTINTIPAFLEALRKSRLLGAADLNEIKARLLPGAADPQVLAGRLVQHGVLTPYQANHILEGLDQELVVGPYRLLNLLGEGGLSQVFQAEHTGTRTLVALKILHPELRSNRKVLDQLRQEMEVITRLSHPHFVQAFELNLEEETGSPYFAMEYVEGIDLGKLLGLVGPLPMTQACEYIRQAALGLEYAYEQGLVHRDIKPANLLISADSSTLRILDIGLARLEWSYKADPAATPTPTNQGITLMGTPDYVAPEQALNADQADIRADIYSLGCTLYHLLAAEPPFPGNSLARKLLHHQQAPPPSIRRLRPEVPEELDAVLQKMMAKQPDERYRTPALVAIALKPFCQGEEVWVSVDQFLPAGTNLEARNRESAVKAQPGESAPGRPRCPATASIPYGTPGYPERRAHVRRGGNLIAVLINDSLHPEEPLRGWVLNRSAAGLSLLVEDALEVDTMVKVRPNVAHLQAFWQEVKVIYCYRERLRWRVGCQFVQKVSWEELRFFG
jgi:serine/threonine protein kinase